jgi:hypothetical protein
MQVADLLTTMVKDEGSIANDDSAVYRVCVRADGRCAVRATLVAAGWPLPEGIEMSRGDGEALNHVVRHFRIKAGEALTARMEADEEFRAIVESSFPDEAYDSFDAWLDAQESDDTARAHSDLWRGGGQWLLFGLGLALKLKIVVSNVSAADEILAPPQDVVDGRADEAGRVAHLAAMHNDDGVPFHFDALVRTPEPGARPLVAQGSARPQPTPRSLTLATNVVCLALMLSIGLSRSWLQHAGDFMQLPLASSPGDTLIDHTVGGPMLNAVSSGISVY